ncbi:tRNA G18 (ribose-2'-O)-methylase SpoU [Luteococcus japonicus]|uniref:tRNA G18 (Ribose-2'-O)-methylase SpoU n=1 Tax=Luteococcus japonicus TaxID=33984 RepID=A0A3N1ZXW1_9ACTN|nr:RNA methyltransferase [Luteococcus japonicus]ROR55691.1 tRNA G18 (ribose-2'-O)-methylase SpoU [Luteococcus japonicus]
MAHFVEITDPTDPRLRDYVSLRDTSLRHSMEAAEGLFIAEGDKVIRRAVEAGYRPRSFLLAPRWAEELADLLEGCDAEVYVVSFELAEQVTGFHVHRGALASMERQTRHTLDDLLDARRLVVVEDIVDHTNVKGLKLRNPQSTRSRIAVFDGLVDHANVGAGFRSAAALGVDAVLVTPTCADPLYRRSVKTSMGTVFQVPWTRIESWPARIDALHEAGYVVAGLTLEPDSITLDELVAEDHERLALVFGTEGHGLAPNVVQRLDRKVIIPMMQGVDSLNVAAASAVAFYATR